MGGSQSNPETASATPFGRPYAELDCTLCLDKHTRESRHLELTELNLEIHLQEAIYTDSYCIFLKPKKAEGGEKIDLVLDILATPLRRTFNEILDLMRGG